MRQVWRRLLSVGAVTAVGASALAQGGVAAAGTAALAGHAHVAVTSASQAAAWTPVTRTLKPGMHGADVKKVQRRLRALGYYPGKPDGDFGSNTLEAVWAFKGVQGLSTSKNPNNIGHTMEHRLADPRTPKPICVAT